MPLFIWVCIMALPHWDLLPVLLASDLGVWCFACCLSLLSAYCLADWLKFFWSNFEVFVSNAIAYGILLADVAYRVSGFGLPVSWWVCSSFSSYVILKSESRTMSQAGPSSPPQEENQYPHSPEANRSNPPSMQVSEVVDTSNFVMKDNLQTHLKNFETLLTQF